MVLPEKTLIKNLHVRPYKVTTTHQMLKVDYECKVQYWYWFNDKLNAYVLNNTFMSNEARFHHQGIFVTNNTRRGQLKIHIIFLKHLYIR